MTVVYEDHSAAFFESGFERFCQSGSYGRLEDNPIYDDFNIVLLVFSQGDVFGQISNFSVDSQSHKAIFARLFDYVFVLPFAPRYQGRKNLKFASLGESLDHIYDLVYAYRLDLPSAIVTMLHSSACKQ
jgi:hypothetical protein